MDMASGREEVLFLAFKRQPSPETLTALLRGHQDHIYNICFQVLRHPEDAEDVSQEVLLEVTQGISRVEAPRQFKVWLYRVALHSSLNLKQARARRVELARKLAASPPTEGAPMDAEERAALMRAIGGLEDETRCLLMEHYFDKLTLEEIGQRAGISSVAAWKRLDRAKEHLRKSLQGAGFAVAAAGVVHSLESLTPVVAPAGLIGKAVVAGGIAVGTKSVFTGGTIVAALLLVGAASTGGYLAGNGRAAAHVRELQAEMARLSRSKVSDASPAQEAPATLPTPEAPVETPAEAPTPPAAEGKREVSKAAFVPDPTPVSYGRPMKARLEELQNAATWEDFYKKVQEQKSLGSETLENLIFQRVSKELSLDVTEAQSIRKLFDAEREETTRVIIESAGGPAGFSKMKEDLGMNWKVIYDDWRRQRNIVRQTHDLDYQKFLTYDQLQFFNQHLRNSEIGFEASYGPEGRYYLITGVGRSGK